MDERQQFQGKCYLSANGKDFMSDFDYMPIDARRALQNSPFNICAACVMDEAMAQAARGKGNSDRWERYLLPAIGYIENRIRCEEVPQAQ